MSDTTSCDKRSRLVTWSAKVEIRAEFLTFAKSLIFGDVLCEIESARCSATCENEENSRFVLCILSCKNRRSLHFLFRRVVLELEAKKSEDQSEAPDTH